MVAGIGQRAALDGPLPGVIEYWSREAHSSSGPGRRPLKAEITGSNPVCATYTAWLSSQAVFHAVLLGIRGWVHAVVCQPICQTQAQGSMAIFTSASFRAVAPIRMLVLQLHLRPRWWRGGRLVRQNCHLMRNLVLPGGGGDLRLSPPLDETELQARRDHARETEASSGVQLSILLLRPLAAAIHHQHL